MNGKAEGPGREDGPVVNITGVAHGGDGVCRVAGQVCFVPYALPGDNVRLRIARRAKGVLWGAIDEVVEPSRDRIATPCSAFGTCGGCGWLHFAYPAQAEWKRRIVRDCLARMAGIEIDLDWAEDPNLRTGYRTRAEFHGTHGRLGFYERGTHTVTSVHRCPLCHDHLNAALDRLRDASVTGPVDVVVNPEGPEVTIWTKEPRPDLAKHFPLAGSVRDKKPFYFMFDGAPIVNGAFSQSSLLLNRVLVRTVRDLVGEASSVLDLYCGNGNLSLNLAAGAHVLGIDHNRAAVQAASEIGRGEYRADGESAFRAALGQPWDAVLLDPPRAGAKAIAADLASSSARRIVYVSCDPATLARDLKVLAARGWRVVKAVAVDMFPNTAHVEIVCRLERPETG